MSAAADPAAGLSAAIQPHGGLIACDPDGDRISHVSANIADLLGQGPEDLLGGSLTTLLSRDLRHNLRNMLSLRRFRADRHFAGRHDLAMGQCDVSISSSVATGHILIEFEPALEPLQSAEDFAAELRHLSDELRSAATDAKLLDTLAGLLRVATGYDSAVICRFTPKGGEIVAEARNSSRQRMMGQRPADIGCAGAPQQDGRRPVPHFISDARAAQTPVLASTGETAGLDMFYCHLRGATAAEAATLGGLNARAMMSLPLAMNDGHWGVAALLHRSARTPSRYNRQLCDALVSVVCDRMQILRLSEPARPAAAIPKPARRVGHRGKSVLVVEDNRMIAADLKLTLLDLGFEAVDLFDDEASALSFLASHRVDLGVLDIHLAGDATSFNVAGKLASEGMPFIFASGYGEPGELPGAYGDRPIILKPITRRKLSAKIEEALAGDAPASAAGYE